MIRSTKKVWMGSAYPLEIRVKRSVETFALRFFFGRLRRIVNSGTATLDRIKSHFYGEQAGFDIHEPIMPRVHGTWVRPICVVVEHDPPPIPIRTRDWCAYEDGMEERQMYGWGRTREEAVAALFNLFEDGGE